MAHRGWRHLPSKSRKHVAGYVKSFFRSLEHWEVEDKPLLARIRSWDHTDRCGVCVANRPEAERTHNWYKLNTCHCTTLICDLVAEMEYDWNPYYYNQNGLEGGYRYRRWQERWADKVRCCLRAGIDVACEPSAGVLGFEVCDLRRMYRDAIPGWLNAGWENPDGQPANLNVGKCKVSIWL